MEKPTEKQNKVLQVIRDFLKENGYPPTLQEIGDRMDMRSKNAVFKHLVALERKGQIKRGSNISRGIQVANNHADEMKLEIFAPGMTEEDKLVMSRAHAALFDVAKTFGVPSDAVGFKYGKDKEGNLVIVYIIDSGLFNVKF